MTELKKKKQQQIKSFKWKAREKATTPLCCLWTSQE